MSSPHQALSTVEEKLPMPPPGGGSSTYWLLDVGVVLLAIFLLTLLLVGVSYASHRVRLSKWHRKRRSGTAPRLEVHSAQGQSAMRRRRRLRRSKRRNPTLADTAGLPPKRLADSEALDSSA